MLPSFRGLTHHSVFDKADHEGKDRTGDAPTYGLSDNTTDIDIPGSSSEHRQERCQNLPTTDSAECTRDTAPMMMAAPAGPTAKANRPDLSLPDSKG